MQAASGLRPELGEDVSHLESGPHGVRSAVDPLLGLLARVHGQDAERDRHAGLERSELEAARRLARHVVEVRRLAADHAAERDHAGVAAGLRERHRGERELERAGNRHDHDRVARDTDLLELLERTLE